MKLKILIIGLLAMASFKCFAQGIEFYYDAAGNRVMRKVIGVAVPIAPQPNDTTEFNISSEDVTEPVLPEVYEDFLAEKQLKIYPNPTRGRLKIDMVNYNLSDNGSIQVFDMGGRLVRSINNLSESMEVDITAEPAGQYIMIIIIGNEKSEWKIIKQ